MSRVGKNPIKIPKGVEVSIQNDIVNIKGPLGTLSQKIHPDMKVLIEESEIIISKTSEQKSQRAIHGLTRSLIANAVKGVTEKFEKVLTIEGVGYKAEVKDNTLILQLGFSHPVDFNIPKGIEIKVERQNRIAVYGIDKQQVGEVTAEIRNLKCPEPYKGKGIRYLGEYVKRKVGKTGVAAGTAK